LKLSFFDKKIRKQYMSLLGGLSTISAFAFIVIEIPYKYKKPIGIIMVIVFLLLYFILWFNANRLESIDLRINNSIINVKIGNIFNETNSLKVISFNEYFDTKVDNIIISDKTLNGVFINNYVINLDKLDKLIESDEHLKLKKIDYNINRNNGKKFKYMLGSILNFENDFLLTAFAKFDDNNRAYLSIQDYINFLFNFWNELDVFYQGQNISLPLLGAGITRFKDYNMSEQELLELIIWSFKISNIRFGYNSKISIILNESIKDKIDLYKLE
jgi:hypothetical protein